MADQSVTVLQIKAHETDAWCEEKHYMKRRPFISFAFGIFLDRNLEGIVTYGSPHGANLCDGIFRNESLSQYVIELNRLCIDSSIKNAGSILVSRSIKLLPKPKCIISFSDTGYGHIGYIYQAANFIYTGTTVAHNPEFLIGGKKVPNRTISDWGISSPVKWAKENGIEMIPPRLKHRYLFFHGTKKQKMEMINNLQYGIVPEYPKGKTSRYESYVSIPIQTIMFD